MKCDDIEKGLFAYVDGRATAGERRDVETHLAGCALCRARMEEFRSVNALLGEVPEVEPSFGFDARVRRRVAEEPRPTWFAWIRPQTRLALSVAMLLALTVFLVKLPPNPTLQPPFSATQTAAMTSSDQDFEAVKDLGVLENYDVVTNLDALSQLVPAKVPEAQKPHAGDSESND